MKYFLLVLLCCNLVFVTGESDYEHELERDDISDAPESPTKSLNQFHDKSSEEDFAEPTKGLATVKIHHDRSSDDMIEATVTAFDETHHLKLEKISEPTIRTQSLGVGTNGSMEIFDDSDEGNTTYYEDPVQGSMLYMNADNTLEGILREDISLKYENNQHHVSKIDTAHMMKNLDVTSLLKRQRAEEMVGTADDNSDGDSFNNLRIVQGELPTDSDENYSFEPTALNNAEILKDNSNYTDIDDAPEESSSTDERRKKKKRKTKFNVEIYIVMDSVLANRIGENRYIHLYTKMYWKIVNKRFRSLKGLRVRLAITGLLILRTAYHDSFVFKSYNRRYANMDRTAWKFSRFMAWRRLKVKKHDIAQLMTGRDLGVVREHSFYRHYTGRSLTTGKPCVVYYHYALNVAVAEDDGLFKGIRTSAQTVARNLGAGTDGFGGNKRCSYRAGYLMSGLQYSYRSSRFSKCSAKAIKRTFKKHSSRCLKKRNARHWFRFPSSYPGLRISLTEQCRRRTGIYRAVPTAYTAYQCVRLHCRVTGTHGMYYYVSRYPALEGTMIWPRGFCNQGWYSRRPWP